MQITQKRQSRTKRCFLRHPVSQLLGCRKWVCNRWEFQGCLASLPGSPLPLFSAGVPFLESPHSALEIQQSRKKAFSQICLDLLKPHYLLNPLPQRAFPNRPCVLRFASKTQKTTLSAPIIAIVDPSIENSESQLNKSEGGEWRVGGRS